MPAGRPTDYDPSICETVTAFCLLGMTDEELAKHYDVAISTISLWKVKHKEFSEAIKRGREEADATVGKRLYQRAIGYNHKEDKIFCHDGKPVIVPTVKHYPPDPLACIYWLNNRRKQNWRQKHDDKAADRDNAADTITAIAALVDALEHPPETRAHSSDADGQADTAAS